MSFWAPESLNEINTWMSGKVWNSNHLTQKPCFFFFFFLLTSPCSLIVSSLSPFSRTAAHIQFCYQFKAQRGVSEGARQSDKLSPKWWQIGRLSARLPIKSRPGFHACTVPVNGDRWHSGEARGPSAESRTVSTLSLPRGPECCL